MSSVRFDDYTKSIDNFYRKNAYQNFYQPVLYYVKAGDSLSQIITNYYDIRFGTKEYELALRHLLFSNSHIKNANAIQPKQVIKLTPMNPSYGPVCTEEEARIIEEAADQAAAMEKYRAWSKQPTSTLTGFVPSDSATQQFMSKIPSDPDEREVFRTLAWLQANTDFLTAGSALGNVLGGLASDQNNALIKEIDKLQEQYKNKKILKAEYDQKAQKLAKTYSQRVGVTFQQAMFNGQTAQQIARIKSSNAFPANSNVLKYADRLNKLSKLASAGGVALTGIGVAKGAYDMCQAKSLNEKNEIFIETFTSTTFGIISGVAISTFIILNPVSWGVALVLGTASAVGSYYTGKGMREIYSKSGDKIDFVSSTNIDAICEFKLGGAKTGFDKLRAL